MATSRCVPPESARAAAINHARVTQFLVSLSIHLRKMDSPVGRVLQMGYLLHKQHIVRLGLRRKLRIDPISQTIQHVIIHRVGLEDVFFLTGVLIVYYSSRNSPDSVLTVPADNPFTLV